jgi:hypothetical protein
MNEYMSLKVSSGEHADLATQLTTLSTQGWGVVNIVSTGVYLVAYLSRPLSSTTSSQAVASVDGASNGWASGTSQASTNNVSTPTTPAVPADWYPDPSGRYEHRYWDGSKWTDNVSRAGVMYKDPPIP